MVEVFSDEGVSGSILDRPGLSSARDRLKETKVDYFICLDPDRLARNLSHQLMITEEIERRGTKLEFVNFDWQNTPEGRLFYSMRGAIAEYEREKIKERSRRGKLQKAKSGKITHPAPPFGYVFDPVEDAFHVDARQAEIVKQIFTWAAEGNNSYRIVEMLNEQGIPAPKGGTWQRATICRMLRNQAYIGIYYVNKHNTEGVKHNRYRPESEKKKRSIRPQDEWIPIPIPAIIEPELFQKVQENLDLQRRLRPGLSKAFYLLSGIVRCGACGSTIHGNLIRNSNKKPLRYYVCTAKSPGKPNTPKCITRNHNADKLEAAVWSWVERVIKSPEILSDELNSIKATNKLQLEKNLQEVTAKISQIQEEKQRVLNLYQKGLINDEDIEPRLKEIANRMSFLEQKYRQLMEAINRSTPAELQELKQLAAKYATHIDNLAPEEKQYLIRMLIKRVEVTDTSIIVFTKAPTDAHLKMPI
ncbi:preprotein translocase subunit TatB [Carboxydocella sp. ULO1]|nr:preprotein translocase subunit TatB [Carboxydocella sp. ULO1]